MLKRSSVSVAKNRLRTLITSDRVSCDPDEYDHICKELHDVLAKYIEFTEDNFRVDITRTHIHITIAGDET